MAVEPGRLPFPVGMGVDRTPGRLDEHEAQVTPALLGDVPGALRLARSVDACPQAGATHQLLGDGEAGDVADGDQDGPGRQERNAGESNEVGNVLAPRGSHAEAVQLRLQVGQLLLEMIQMTHRICTDAAPTRRRERKSRPHAWDGTRLRVGCAIPHATLPDSAVYDEGFGASYSDPTAMVPHIRTGRNTLIRSRSTHSDLTPVP